MKREYVNCPYCGKNTQILYRNLIQPKCLNCGKFIPANRRQKVEMMFCKLCGNRVPKNPTNHCKQCNRIKKLLRDNADIIPAMLEELGIS